MVCNHGALSWKGLESCWEWRIDHYAWKIWEGMWIWMSMILVWHHDYFWLHFLFSYFFSCHHLFLGYIGNVSCHHLIIPVAWHHSSLPLVVSCTRTALYLLWTLPSLANICSFGILAIDIQPLAIEYQRLVYKQTIVVGTPYTSLVHWGKRLWRGLHSC